MNTFTRPKCLRSSHKVRKLIGEDGTVNKIVDFRVKVESLSGDSAKNEPHLRATRCRTHNSETDDT